MENVIDFEKEWEFITAETHSKKFRKISLIKRETLFALQILLSRFEPKNYFTLKKIYCKKLIEK